MPVPNEVGEFLTRAREIVSGYRVVIEPSRGGDFYLGRTLELPKVYARGATRQKCLSELEENVIDAVATLLSLGRVPPRPCDRRLTEQVNVRLSVEEKQRAESLAQQQGFRGLADYVRSVLVKEVRDEVMAE